MVIGVRNGTRGAVVARRGTRLQDAGSTYPRPPVVGVGQGNCCRVAGTVRVALLTLADVKRRRRGRRHSQQRGDDSIADHNLMDPQLFCRSHRVHMNEIGPVVSP